SLPIHLTNSTNCMRFILTIICFICLQVPTSVSAQVKQEYKISGKFENLSLPQFFQQVEKLAPVQFYFDTAKLDSGVVVNISVQEQPLSQVLDKVLQEAQLQYSID